jgi:hypothetical protein
MALALLVPSPFSFKTPVASTNVSKKRSLSVAGGPVAEKAERTSVVT